MKYLLISTILISFAHSQEMTITQDDYNKYPALEKCAKRAHYA